MTVDMSQFYQVFFEEAAEHLAAMENLLLGLDIDAPDPENLNAIFRSAHSIKGGSATFGFQNMAQVTHILESLLDRIRNGELQLRAEMVDIFLKAGDVLQNQLEAHQNGGEADEENARAICEQLSRLATSENSGAPLASGAGEAPAPAADAHAVRTYHIRFEPDDGFPQRRANMDNLIEELGHLGRLSILEDGRHAPDGFSEEAAEGKLLWRFTLETASGEAEINAIFDFVAKAGELEISAEAPGSNKAEEEEETAYGFFTDIPEQAPDQPEEDQGYGFFTDLPSPAEKTASEEAEQGYGFFEEIQPPAPTVTAKAAAPLRTAPQSGEKNALASQSESSIRVSVEKVDHLINLVGELVITQAMLAQTASKLDPEIVEILGNALGQLEHNTRDLQESVMSIRMMPISFVFSRYPRVVRDLCAKLGKQVELKTVGEGTELDKGLIEKLSDPLTHLVRNSLDHGIETPEKRIAAGKPEKGTVTLRASHQGGNIVIEVIDDGAGINRDRILEKAKERGMAVSDSMSDQDVYQLIFAPGFSTADVVTDVSGRGVGMDVVKKNIVNGMGGRIEIDSTLGQGSRITIRLPLTLAILDGMSVGVSGENYIIPLTYIVESLKPKEEDVKTVSGQGRVLHVRGEYIPLVALYEIFNISPKVSKPHEGILVLVEAEGKKIALFVDELLGQHQVVIKSLESNFRKVPGISGATIMGDGKVALILDMSSLVSLSRNA
ncbi:MAG: chemotaxis protein CheA [Sulfuricellaceae bacterium]|nr:chemotaxis protein CheA [Sulfuricellaceae bacterium]